MHGYIELVEDEHERDQCLGELEFLLAETKYNDVRLIGKHLRKALTLVHQPVRFFSPQTIWGGGAKFYSFYVLPAGRNIAADAGYFPRGDGGLL